MERERAVRRVSVFLLATAVCSFGVDLTVKGALGTAPISSVPYVCSLIGSLSFGTFTFIINMIFFLAGIAVLGKGYRLSNLWTIPTLLIFSALNDAFLYVLDWLIPPDYLCQWVLTVAGCVVLALGVALQLASNVSMMPADYLIRFITTRFGTDFGRTKVIFDVCNMVAAAVLSLMVLGGLEGIREGTVFSAVFTGLFIRLISGRLMSCGVYGWLGQDASEVR